MNDRQERRKEDATVAELLSMMRSMMNDFNGHADKLVCIERKLDNILTAFPDGGLMGHRLYHERAQTNQKTGDELRASVIKNVLSGGAWATLVIVTVALWEYFKVKVGK